MMWSVLAVVVVCAAAAAAVRLGRSAVFVRAERRRSPDPLVAARVRGDLMEVSTGAADGVALRGWLFRPAEGRWNGDAALLLHGFTSSREAMAERAAFLVEQGFAVLVPDSRGHGSSGGRLVTFGLHEVGDLRAWADWLCRELGIASFCALGESMGAGVLLQAVAVEPRIRAAIADSPLARFADAAYERFAARAGVPVWVARTLLRPIAEMAWLYIRWFHGVDLRTVRPVEGARVSRVPLLLIHGLADLAIPYSQSLIIRDARPAGTELWLVPGVGHAEAWDVAEGEYRARVADFLCRASVGRGTA